LTGAADDRTPKLRAGTYLSLAIIVSAAHVYLLAWQAYRDSATWDEVAHFAAGIEHWRHFRFELFNVNPPLVRMVGLAPIALFSKLDSDAYIAPRGPGLRPEFFVGSSLAQDAGSTYFLLMTTARLTCISFSLIGAWVCSIWARELWGQAAGLIALTVWSFSPSVLAYGHMITPDLGAAGIGAAAAYRFRKWLIHPTAATAVTAGFLLALMELTKTTWIIVLVLWPLLWLGRRWANLRVHGKLRTESAQLAVIFVIGWWGLNCGYLFEGTFKDLGEYNFVSYTLKGGTPIDPTSPWLGNRFAHSPLGRMWIPLPENYVQGIDYIKMEFEQKRWSYLDGEWKLGGWWYYYFACLAYKEPLGNWGLVILATGLLIFAWRKYAAPWREELLILVPLLTLLIFIGSQDGFSHHIRYILPIFPFCCIYMGRLGRVFRFGPKWLMAIVIGLLGWSVVSSLSVFPHHMSYFNELAGGPKNGYKHLSDSNVDWGQDLLYLKKWYDSHPEARPLHLIYDCALIDPKMAGVSDTLPVPIGPQAIDADMRKPEEIGPQPGWYCLSIKQLHFREKRFVYFEDLTPVDWVGYTMPVYHITLEQANALRRRYGIPELTAAGTTRPTSQPAKAP
jgi:hypothetical protein